MNNACKIKFSQLMLFISLCSFFPILLVNGETLAQAGPGFCIAACVFAFADILLFIFISRRSISNVPKGMYAVLKATADVFLLVTAARFIGFFSDFFCLMINTRASQTAIAAAMLVCVWFAVSKGISGLSASGIIFSAVLGFMLAFLAVGAVPEIDFQNLNGFFYNEVNGTFDFVMLLLSLNFAPTALLLLNTDTLPPKKLSALWVPLVFFICAVLVMFFVAACLGRYAFTQPYPIMTLFRYPRFTVLESVSGILLLVLTLLCLCAVSACVCGIYGDSKKSKLRSFLLCASVFVLWALQKYGALNFNSRIGIYIIGGLSVLSLSLCLIFSKEKS